MGGGKERKASQDLQTSLAREQAENSRKQLDLAQSEMGRRHDLQRPAVDQFMRLLSSNPSERMVASSIPIGQISQQSRVAKESIYDSVPHGAARQAALAQIPRDQASQTSQMLNNAYMSAFPALAGLGTESGQVGLQQTGAGMRSSEAAAQTNNSVIDAQQRQKAATLGMLGSLAGTAGGAIAGSGAGKGIFGFMNKTGVGDRFSNPMGRATGIR